MTFETRVMGHRGAAKLAPENTLASISAAADVGTQWVEIDVTIAADGLVIFHDDTLDRCTNGSGPVKMKSVAELKALEVENQFNPAFSNETIPTLVEALKHIQDLGLSLNLEIKCAQPDVMKIVPDVLAQLAEHWQDKSKLCISSFNHDVLIAVRNIDSDLRLSQIYKAIPNNWPETLSSIHAFSLNCDYALLREETALAIKEAGYLLFCYTVNKPELVQEHWKWGMDAVITDDPSLFFNTGIK
ncbi:glycerophosphodiester phosphodiesterase family protein [Marinomonas sp. 2405UD68-3]|uniref:glycerophosphodiester phosphodiesterase family protein n=1 Tax=Marinomonas sp. 2405UD68-3 TaxID=3391835 RepID=UPI0039C9C16D